MSDAFFRTRFAPTPSGFLHLGNVLSFAITWALARKAAGAITLRIDDMDRQRMRPAFVQDVFDILAFLGLTYDEGPTNPVDFYDHHSQHVRMTGYARLLQRLAEKELVYACTCSRSELNETNKSCSKNCRDKHLSLDTAGAAWRVKIPPEKIITVNDIVTGAVQVNLAAAMPDFVVRGKDGMPGYQLASLADDLSLRINFVVRGNDLLPSTAAQLFLSDLLNEPAFARTSFLHHPLLLDAGGSKLAKSHGSLSVHAMRKSGATAAHIWGMIARVAGLTEPITTPFAFADLFDTALLNQSAAAPRLMFPGKAMP